jgi:18S rRNA (adenine1779-N6/adenine1780-N6)-dimethyltransferase
MLEANYRTWLASQSGGGGSDSVMAEDVDMAKLIDEVLEKSGYADQRAAKMDVDDFLR